MTKQATSSRSSIRRRQADPWGIRTLQRTRRRDLILLAGLVSLACVSMLVVGFLILRFQPEPGAVSTPVAANVPAIPAPQPTYTVTFVQVTGLSQFAPAKAAALKWAADAQLVAASAKWPKVVGKEAVGEPAVWTYRFYSPSKGRLFFVIMNPDGQMQTIEHVAPVTLPPRVIPAEGWVIDSPAALAIWLDYGGAKILGSNPGLEMLIQLRNVGDSPNPVWQVVGLNNQTETVHKVVIDATQGLVTAFEPGS